MLKSIRKTSLMASAAFFAGLYGELGQAHAAATPSSAQTFDNVWRNISQSVGGLPQLISIGAYIFGTLFMVLGVLKIKEHVENPQQTQLKEGAMKLAAGGALFSLPFMTEIMSNLIDGNQAGKQESLDAFSALSYGAGTG